MLVAVLGAAGGTGSEVVSALLARGHRVRGLVRRAESAERVRSLGAEAVLGDLAGDAARLAAELAGADAVINAAGGGIERCAEVDRDGAITAQRAAEHAGVRRYVQISSMFADRPDEGPVFLREVLRAKEVSDRALAESGLLWTIIRPGGLTDDPGTGLVRAADRIEIAPGAARTIPRTDVAAVAVASLGAPAAQHRGFDVTTGTDRPEVALCFDTA